MKLSEINSLVELYFKKSVEEDKKKPFLRWLKPDKPTYNWQQITDSIYKLSNKISKAEQDNQLRFEQIEQNSLKSSNNNALTSLPKSELICVSEIDQLVT